MRCSLKRLVLYSLSLSMKTKVFFIIINNQKTSGLQTDWLGIIIIIRAVRLSLERSNSHQNHLDPCLRSVIWTEPAVGLVTVKSVRTERFKFLFLVKIFNTMFLFLCRSARTRISKVNLLLCPDVYLAEQILPMMHCSLLNLWTLSDWQEASPFHQQVFSGRPLRQLVFLTSSSLFCSRVAASRRFRPPFALCSAARRRHVGCNQSVTPLSRPSGNVQRKSSQLHWETENMRNTNHSESISESSRCRTKPTSLRR